MTLVFKDSNLQICLKYLLRMHSLLKDFLSFREQTALLWDNTYRLHYVPLFLNLPAMPSKKGKISVICLAGFCLNKHSMGLSGTSFSASAENIFFHYMPLSSSIFLKDFDAQDSSDLSHFWASTALSWSPLLANSAPQTHSTCLIYPTDYMLTSLKAVKSECMG